MARMKSGWFGESRRHSLASKGVKTRLDSRAVRLPSRAPASFKAKKPMPKTPFDIPGFEVGDITVHENAKYILKDDQLEKLLYRHVRGDWGDLSKGDKEMQTMFIMTYDIYEMSGIVNSLYYLDENKTKGIVISTDLSPHSAYTEIWSVAKRSK